MDKAFPQAIKAALLAKSVLHCNRRGVVPMSSGIEKPTIGVEELLSNRRRGLSYASIGRKLGIDPSKEEVLHVFKVLKDDAGTPDIEGVPVAAVKQYPTPLWYLWNSELNIIADHAIPSSEAILCKGLPARTVSRLGDEACLKASLFS